MQIVRNLAGYSLGRADILRRAMGKKKGDVMEKERKSFIYGDDEVDGAVKRGVNAKTANEIFDDMVDFAKYAFNKSHAAAYAQIAYQTAWLKTFYPVEFMAALLSAHIDDTAKITQYIDEMTRLKIKLLPPNINISNSTFAPKDGNISFGLAAVKNVGKAFAEQTVTERKNGNFKSLSDFCRRMSDKGISKRALEALIMAGAFDSLGGYRSQYLAMYESIADQAATDVRTNLSGQISLMGEVEINDNLPNIDEFDRRRLLSMEKEITGIYISGHPLDNFAEKILLNSDTTINKISGDASRTDEALIKDSQKVRIAGIITKKVKKYTKKDDEMAFITIEDLTGSIEVIVFPKLLTVFDSILYDGSIVSITGKVSYKEEEMPKIILDGVYALKEEKTQQYKLYIKVPITFDQNISKLTNVLEIFSGDVPVYLYFEKDKQIVCAPEQYSVSPCETLNEEIKKVLGEGCDIVLKKRKC